MLFIDTLHAGEMPLIDVFMSNQSAGIIYPFSHYLKQIEPLCGNSAKGLYMAWFDRNKTLVNRVNISQMRYYESIAKESGKSAAVQAKAEQDNISSNIALMLTRMLTIQSTNRQENYCKKLNTEVSSGKL